MKTVLEIKYNQNMPDILKTVAKIRAILKGLRGSYKIYETKESRDFMRNLPFDLTGAQMRALQEMKADLQKDEAMNRLVQGDVGSGKTILAVILLLMTATNGYQGALMAPTEVLAVQHYETFCKMLEPYQIRIALLTGSSKAKE